MLRKWLCQADIKITLTPLDALLIKSGYADISGSDMTPVSMTRNGEQVYYLPGTSLKGVFRSHLEKIARSLEPGSVCIPYYDPRQAAHAPPASEETKSFGCGYLLNDEPHKPTVYRKSCPICRIFGNLQFGGRLAISDALPTVKPTRETRNGVGIDRFTGGSARGVLFDMDVLVGGVYETTLRIENFELWQLSAIGLLLQDMEDEMLQVGSGRSRSLGRVKGEITEFRLSYLRGRTTTLVGIAQMESPDSCAEYGLYEWCPEAELQIENPRTRGLREVYDVKANWAAWSGPMVPGFDYAIQQYRRNPDTAGLRDAARCDHVGA